MCATHLDRAHIFVWPLGRFFLYNLHFFGNKNVSHRIDRKLTDSSIKHNVHNHKYMMWTKLILEHDLLFFSVISMYN